MRYGILKERMAALITDGLRAELLESKGYETQLLEFIDMEHTPKNILIRAVKTGKKKSRDSFSDTITHNRLEHFVSDLTIQFMLTAWNRQDHLSPPFHCLGQSEICCCIAGMKCHHHVHRRNAFVPCNISLVKMQL